MKAKSKLRILAAALVITAVALSLGKIYIVRDDSGGTVLWNSTEAYLFVDVHRRGARISYLKYPFVILKQLLYGVHLPDDQQTSVTVVHIKQVEVERYIVQAEDEEQANTPALYKVIEDHIYANYHGHAYRWAGNKFEKATEEEQGRYDETNQNVADIEKYPGGWSKRSFGEASNNYQFSIDVGGTFSVNVTNSVSDQSGTSLVSIDVQPAGHAPQNIWQLDGRPRRVSRRDYEGAFSRLR